ncbi:hypothetical protein [Clostridium culturomicium]|uniref:hypothetical protein n=1 Tax=Clostridium culturomicium TaxID=1499683 RepID=UPI0005913CFC|nr:hypothetical protein [Clostridium culturomicium]
MNTQQIKETIVENLKIYLQELKDNKTIYKVNLLPNIVQLYINTYEKSTVFSSLQQHLMEVYLSDPSIILDYIQLPIWINDGELGPDFKTAMKHINTTKNTYGGILKEYKESWKNPFLITTVEANVENNESVHNLTISRADGVHVKGQFKPQSILPIIQMLMSATQVSIEKGIYNLDLETIQNYIKSSSEFNEFLLNLISSGRD